MRRTLLMAGTACAALLPLAAASQDAAQCKGKLASLNVIGQGMPAVTSLDDHLAEFNAKWDTEVKITLLGENERRAKARLDTSTGAGTYQVLYIDEANLAGLRGCLVRGVLGVVHTWWVQKRRAPRKRQAGRRPDFSRFACPPSRRLAREPADPGVGLVSPMRVLPACLLLSLAWHSTSSWKSIL